MQWSTQAASGARPRALHITQPALSRIIKRLESQLRAPLFERHAAGMELTSFGQALLPYATLLEAESAHAFEEIEALRDLDRGVLRIGAVASVVLSSLPGMLERILARQPGLHNQITEAVEDKLAVALSNNAIDIAVAGQIAEDEDIVRVAEHDFDDRYAVIASASHALSERSSVAIPDILGLPRVMPPEGAEPRVRFQELMARLGVDEPVVSVETRSPSAIKAMVACTHFLGWLPEPHIAAEHAAGQIVALPIAGMVMERRFFIYRRRRSFTSPPLRCFLEEVGRSTP